MKIIARLKEFAKQNCPNKIDPSQNIKNQYSLLNTTKTEIELEIKEK